MICPNCGEPMKEEIFDNQTVLHCINCGSSFFEENGINRISEKSAETIASEKKQSIVSAKEKFCPRDKTKLQPLEDKESIPSHIYLLSCKTCRGVFAYANDLRAFKRAQNVKIEYFKLWNIPLPSMRTVMVFASLVLVAGSVLVTLTSFTKTASQQIQASDLVKRVEVIRSGHYVLLNFQTTVLVQSQIIFQDKTSNTSVQKNISTSPSTFHSLTTGDINLDDEIFYSILLIDEKGKVTITEEKKLITN